MFISSTWNSVIKFNNNNKIQKLILKEALYLYMYIHINTLGIDLQDFNVIYYYWYQLEV